MKSKIRRKAVVLTVCAVLLMGMAGAITASVQADNDADATEGVLPPMNQDQNQKISEPILSQGKMLIDRTHGQTFNVSGFTDYLVSQGWIVDQLNTGPITRSRLEGYDIFLIPYAEIEFTSSEIDSIVSYVEDGGGIWVFGEYGRDTTTNSVSQEFGVTFNDDTVYDPTDNVNGTYYWPLIHILKTHPITEGVESFGYYAGCSLNVNQPSKIIAKGDDDAYSTYYTSYPPVLAAVEYGSGKAVFCGDMTPLHPNYYPERLTDEEKLLLSNIVEWLLAEEKPSVSISTDKFKYCPCDNMTVTMDISNPTDDPVIFKLYLGVPTFGYWRRIYRVTLPANFNKTFEVPFHIGEWSETPFSAVWYVDLQDPETGQELDADCACWSYCPRCGKTTAMSSMPPLEDIATKIVDEIEGVA